MTAPEHEHVYGERRTVDVKTIEVTAIGHRFSIGLRRDDTLVGVVIAGHPVARKADDGRTIELLRLTTVGDRNACSRLYGAACRAAFAMGYRKVITYTLEDEPGASLRASGFVDDGLTDGHDGWKHGDGALNAAFRPRLFDPPKMPTGPKRRWVKSATKAKRIDWSNVVVDEGDEAIW